MVLRHEEKGGKESITDCGSKDWRHRRRGQQRNSNMILKGIRWIACDSAIEARLQGPPRGDGGRVTMSSCGNPVDTWVEVWMILSTNPYNSNGVEKWINLIFINANLLENNVRYNTLGIFFVANL
ncbi:hypothetical protein PIB30_058585 [Stylosanthes scabra]|uniref:Uncharacterized protein n=1 Tax=Stylosanthes scabra TaxID=79078 RepID=A0ABU6TJR9_9FABA|nr:hypothetical protein [Stylosanthes scabra]